MKLNRKYIQQLACVLALGMFTTVNTACEEDPESDDVGNDGGSAGSGSKAGSDSKAGEGGEAGDGSKAGEGGEAGTDGKAGSDSKAGEGGEAGTGGDVDGGTDAAVEVPPCDPTELEVEVTDDITADTTWECGTYLLQDLILVKDNATLTIDPGVVVLGDTPKSDATSALIVTRGAKLNAVGTAEEPITFSSAVPEGARAPGQWGGVVLLGKAKINSGTAITGGYENNIEGLDPLLATSKYGGTDDAHNCGHLKFVRIEFAGYELSAGNELNGLTVGACGSDTKLHYLQVHRGSDDGMEFFGGTAGMDHVVLSGNSDDSLDWDLGWRGDVQFVVVHQATNDGDKGFEADNLGGNETATPRSNPTIYNVTMIGNPAKTGMNLREGTLGTFRNFIVQDFAIGVDINSTSGMADPATEWPSMLSIEDSVFFNVANVGDADGTDDDNGFDEDAALKNAARSNETTVDPDLGDISITAPDYKPAGTGLTGKATPPAGFDTAATYAGAINPAGDDWTADWTAYPEN